ncbi:MAG: hypothetical protein JNM33_06280 [Rubrivivax sp.]|nr:hypothetical protein [Rubrivivax sp.]
MPDDDAFWACSLPLQPFYITGLSFADYAPAFRLARAHYREDTLLDDVLGRLGSEWEEVKGASRLAWCEAREAVCAAWARCNRHAACESETGLDGHDGAAARACAGRSAG